MTTSAVVPNPTLNPCACGCGELARGRYKRGHKLRAEAGAGPLPGPGDDPGGNDDDEPGEPEAGPGSPSGSADPFVFGPAGQPEPEPEPVGGDEPEPVGPDRPAGRLKERRSAGPREPGRGGKVTAAVRRDVLSKTRFVLMPVGKAWAARDPLCGGTFASQEPEISEAWAEIVCGSPDLLEFYTGEAGEFMKYIRLLFALAPVGFVMWGHHLSHPMHRQRSGPGEPCPACGAAPGQHCVSSEVNGQQPGQQQPAYAA